MPAGPEEKARRRERSLQKVALVTGLAAGLALFAIGLSAVQWQGPGTPNRVAREREKDPLLAKLLAHNIRLARSATPLERVKTLARVAEDLRGETRSLVQASAVAELTAVAKLYEQVLEEGVLEHARRLGAADRGAVLSEVATQLADAGSEAEQMALEATPEVKKPLLAMAEAARRADNRLRELARV
jgi:hypothetical protein